MVARGEELARAIAAHPPRDRDAFVDALLGLEGQPDVDEPCVADDPELIRCVASGVSAVADAIRKAGIGPDDVFVDLGAGVGRVAMLVHLLTGARAVGLEIQEGLVAFGRGRVAALGLAAVDLLVGDAREDELPEGSVHYLYLPFVGRSLGRVLAKLEVMARRRPLVVCALGVELRREGWLRPVDETSLWMSVHESVATATSRHARPVELPSLAVIADERAVGR